MSSQESQLLAESLVNEAPEEPARRQDAPQSEFLPSASADVNYEPATVVPMFAASRDDREIIILRGIEQNKPAVIAVLLGIESNTVSKRYARALEKLRKALGPSLFDDM